MSHHAAARPVNSNNTALEAGNSLADEAAPMALLTRHGRWMSANHLPGLVSVVIPTYNRARLLPGALDSVRNQTYRPIELLVVDDGSTDETQRLLQQWAQENPDDETFTLRLLAQAHGGAPAARNLGLIESRGEFIQFLDSDDLFHPRKLERLVRILQDDPSAEYTWSDWTIVDDARLEAYVSEAFLNLAATASAKRISGRSLSKVPTKAVVGLFRRRLCVEVGPWEESLVRHQDWEYMMRLVSQIEHAWHVPSPLYVIRRHGQGRIDDLKRNRRAALDARIAAARAAEWNMHRRCGKPSSEPVIFRRLASRYFSLMRYSLKEGSWSDFVVAWRGFWRNWSWRPASARFENVRGSASHSGFQSRPKKRTGCVKRARDCEQDASSCERRPSMQPPPSTY